MSSVFRKKTVGSCSLSKLAISGMCVLLWMANAMPASRAQSKSGGWVSQKIEISALGDANCQMKLKLPADAYTAVKSSNVNSRVFLRRLGWEHIPASIRDVKLTYIDDTSELHVQWLLKGYASRKKGVWTAPVLDLLRSYEMLNRLNAWNQPMGRQHSVRLEPIQSNEVLLFESVSQEFVEPLQSTHPLSRLGGPANASTRISFPSPTRRVWLSEDRSHVCFELEEESDNNQESDFTFRSTMLKPNANAVDLKIDTKPRIMSSLCKTYGTSLGQTLWMAKFSIENKGETSIKALRIRCRLNNCNSMDWTPVQFSDELQPKQTFVTTFHPILNPQMLSEYQSTQRANIILEYQYEDSRGRTFGESFSKPIDILPRNEVIWSQFSNDEAVSFQDRYNLFPLVAASVTTKDDPVVQRVAGRISHMNGPCDGQSDQGAMNFLENVHAFCKQNIAYQTPGTVRADHNLGQHVKYARDVLSTNAGTCMDLAILYASLCEAIGLEPQVIGVPGHAFIAIKLPHSKTIVPFETTAIHESFENARRLGQEKYEEMLESGQGYIVSIRSLRDDGVYPLDLEKVSDGVLDSWGLKFRRAVPQAELKNSDPNNPPSPTQDTKHDGINRVRSTGAVGFRSSAVSETQLVREELSEADQMAWDELLVRADSFLEQGQNRMAIRTYLKMLRINPQDPTALNNLAWARFLDDSNLEQALKEATQSVALSPESEVHDALDTEACIRFRLGQEREALQLVLKAISKGEANGAEPEFFEIANEHLHSMMEQMGLVATEMVESDDQIVGDYDPAA